MNEETMKMLSEKNPEIEKAYDTLLDISSDEGEQYASQQREMCLQNEAAINREKFELGKQQRNIEFARKMTLRGESVEEIMDITDLSIEEIENLKS